MRIITQQCVSVSEMTAMINLPVVDLIGNPEESATASNACKDPVDSCLVRSAFDVFGQRIFIVQGHDGFGHEELIAECCEHCVVALILVETAMERMPHDVEGSDGNQAMIGRVCNNFKMLEFTQMLHLAVVIDIPFLQLHV